MCNENFNWKTEFITGPLARKFTVIVWACWHGLKRWWDVGHYILLWFIRLDFNGNYGHQACTVKKSEKRVLVSPSSCERAKLSTVKFSKFSLN